MTKIRMTVFALVLALLPLASVHGQAAQQSFGFNAARISGFLTGVTFMTGGGAYNLKRAFQARAAAPAPASVEFSFC